MTKRYLTLFILFFVVLLASAQQPLRFSVAEFSEDPLDTSASFGEYAETDGSGAKYAIIKVSSEAADDNLTAYLFNFGNLAHHVKSHGDRLWVYVQRNAKIVTISRSGYAPVSRYDLGTTIEAGHVYNMRLTSDRIQQVVVYDVKIQMVVFKVTPAVQGCMVTVRNQDSGEKIAIGTTDENGMVSKPINFGRYTYEIISADNLYHPSEGLISLSNSDETLTESVTLRPNFADVKLSVDGGAEIFVNNQSKGKGSWSGRLTPGTYVVACKQPNHRDSQQRLTIVAGESQNVKLAAPTPITGVLVVNSTPVGATIMIDGKDHGQSPQIMKDVLIGSHKVDLVLSGYRTESKNVVVEEGRSVNVEVVMSKSASDTPKTPIASNGNTIVARAVDLGLSVKWADMNVGASNPEGYGDYFAWGETKPKTNYSWDTYFDSLNGSSSNFSKYATSKKTVLDPEDDAATVNWGGSWRMPTRAEQDELRNNCVWTWTTRNGINGYEVKSKVNGNSVFLPAAGWRSDGSLRNVGSGGYFWSASLGSYYSDGAYFLSFYSSDVDWGNTYRNYGRSVRAVCP